MSNYPSSAQIRSAQQKAVGGAKPRCIKGKSCSAACIEARDRCLIDFPITVSRSASIVRDKVRQLELFPAKKYVSDGIFRQRANKIKKEVERGVISAIQDNNKDTYNSYRQRIIAYNNGVIKDGLEGKGLLKVPATWERAMEVKKAYYRASSKIEDRLKKAANEGDRDKYQTEEKRLFAIQRRLGVKVGDVERYEKGHFWNINNGDKNEERRIMEQRARPFMDRVRNKLRKMGASVERDGDNITISAYSSGYNVKMSLGDNGTKVFFKTDNSFSKPKGMEKEDARQVAGTVKEMFEAITSSLNKGSVLVASPYKKDGKGESRRRAFRMAGFKSASPTGDMYARVEGDGKIVGIDWRQAVSRLEMGNF